MINQKDWDLDAILPIDHQISSQYFKAAPAGVIENFTTLLSRDVFSEADAQVLYDHLIQRRNEFSSEFVEMLHPWLQDELKHYEALRRTYHGISGVSYAEMDQLFDDRIHEFPPIDRVLEDEFTILVTMMFDEIGSVYSYRRDLKAYYCHFGVGIHQIGHHLVKDEGRHFNNAAELLLRNHGDRLGQVESLLHEIAELEDHLGKYYKSFFLDHAQEQFRFTPNFNQTIIQVSLARLGLAAYPEPVALRELWQWVPGLTDRAPANGIAG